MLTNQHTETHESLIGCTHVKDADYDGGIIFSSQRPLCFVCMLLQEVDMAAVLTELRGRFGISGVEEKASRKGVEE